MAGTSAMRSVFLTHFEMNSYGNINTEGSSEQLYDIVAG
jgi:hypothetical protein